MTNVMVSAASQPTLAKSARMGHPLLIMGKEDKPGEGWATRHYAISLVPTLSRKAAKERSTDDASAL